MTVFAAWKDSDGNNHDDERDTQLKIGQRYRRGWHDHRHTPAMFGRLTGD